MAFAPSPYSQGYGDINPDAVDAWTSLISTATGTGIGVYSTVKANKAAKKAAARKRRAGKKRGKAGRIQAAVEEALAANAPSYPSYARGSGGSGGSDGSSEKKGPPIGLIVGAIAIVGIGGFFFVRSRNKKKKTASVKPLAAA